MEIRILLVSLLLFSFFSTVANACPSGNPFSTAYIRRNNRCEGLLNLNMNTSILPDLISFATSNLTEYPNNLKIQVPGKINLKPRIRIQSFFKSYRLDKLETEYLKPNYRFDLNTKTILQHRSVQITFNMLRSLAFIIEDSEPVYFPVILGENSGEYEFVINSLKKTALPVLEIRYQGKTVFSEPRNNPQQGHIFLTWKYKDAPAGRYELYLETSEGDSRSFPFEHDPNWFNN
ncbi:MAG: hypothetical protein QNJ55_36255 [Xenococcus sp. MO_188.B8]|nr:hypothetical protein [Xenococcus sp. MO_188.B8]